MESSGLSAADVLSIMNGKGNDGFSFGGVGGFILLFIFLLAIGGNGFLGGNNATSSQLALSDINMAQYFQSQDSAIRGLAQGQCGITDAILNANYNNLLASKDISNQISNQTLAITSAMAQNTNTILATMNENVIADLRERLQDQKDQNSNLMQNQYLLSQLGRFRAFPPCYDCGCGQSSLF